MNKAFVNNFGKFVSRLMRRNGKMGNFTLVELLVVVAIIAILAGLLMPVLNKARAKGQAIKCVSNLKQLGLGFNQYCNDNEEMLPPTEYKINDTAVKWPNYLMGPNPNNPSWPWSGDRFTNGKYVNTKCLSCPTMPSPPNAKVSSDSGNAWENANWWTTCPHYAINDDLRPSRTDFTTNSKITKIKNPSQKMLLVDACATDSSKNKIVSRGYYRFACSKGKASTTAYWATPHARHDLSINRLKVDGSVNGSKVFDLFNPWATSPFTQNDSDKVYWLYNR